MRRIINVYIFNEIWPNFATSLLVFSFIVLAGRILKLTEWMINHGTHLSQLLLITLYTLPYVLFYTLPMATLLSSIIAFSRLNEDNEIIALKSSGISVSQLMPPVFAFSVISFILALITSIYLIPVSNYSLSSLLFDVAKSSTSIGIKEGVFNNSIPNIVMYADHISSQDHSMEGLFIFDERDPDLPNTIIARKGRIYSDSQQMSIALHLSDGSILMVGKQLDTSRVLQFKSYQLNIGLSDLMSKFSSQKKGIKEMTISELKESIKDSERGTIRHNKLSLTLQKKFSIPFSCLLLGIIGFPLGLMVKAKGKSWGIALSIGIFICYYALLTASDSLGETGKIDPTLAMWIPNILLGISTIIILWKKSRDF